MYTYIYNRCISVYECKEHNLSAEDEALLDAVLEKLLDAPDLVDPATSSSR